AHLPGPAHRRCRHRLGRAARAAGRRRRLQPARLGSRADHAAGGAGVIADPTPPRERRLEVLLTDLLLGARSALRQWREPAARARLRASCDRAQAWLTADAAAQRVGTIEARRNPEPPAPPPPARLPYRDD